ncbi:ATP-binding protein [Cohnella suwonensis]|uniref:histidine kinase n=1 Tax=Cohnella suwonensis TaxID=696072 RepID=A0ABW0LZW1_9BACL
MMKKRKILAIIGLFLLFLTGVRLIWIALQAPPAQTEAGNGQLDLRNWDFSSKPLLSLKGQWEFYPYQLIDPKNATEDDAAIVRLPGGWTKSLSSDNAYTLGYGSYRLRIMVDPNGKQTFRIRVPAISTSSSLFVNGRLLAQSGQPAERAEGYTAGNVPYSASFAADRGVVDIVLHVANFDDRLMGGILQPIKFGTEEAVNRAHWFSVGTQLAVILILSMHAIYSIILYFIGARERALVYFALLIVSAIVTILIDDDRILQAWFHVDYESNYKLYYLSFLSVAVFILMFFKQLMPPFFILKAAPGYAASCGLYALFALFLPVRLLTQTDILHTLLVAIPFLIVPVLIVLAVRRGHPDAVYLMLGSTALMSNLIWGIIKNASPIEIGYYPFDALAAFVAFALFWFKRYFRNAAQAARLTAQLQAEDKLKDEFLVNTSHELRNPLHGILNIAQAVLESDSRQDEERNRARMRLLVSVGKRMSFLLNDLLDLTRLKENRIRLQPTSIRLQDLAAGVLDMIRFMTEGKPIELVNDIPETLPPVLADENRLIQILFNLLHNAVKFTDEGQIRIDASAMNGIATVRIADSGIGMDEETQSKIFRPYEQGGIESSAGIAGIGLGLTISKRLAELHQGDLAVSSAPNRGSVFSFTLPLFDSTDSQEAARDARTPVPLVVAETAAAREEPLSGHGDSAYDAYIDADRPRILAIDDDPVNLNVLVGVLSPDRYEITTATGGAEAISLLNDGTWDLVISDVMMPRMSGYEVAQAVRARFSPSELPILLLTARSRTEDIEAGFRSGTNDYITKPVDALELKSRVRALTEVARAARVQTRMEAAWLQAQIQPHFLFNTLNAIAALSEFDNDRMRNLLGAFGDYLRASFDFRNSDRLIPLLKELELVRAYLFIEQQRFEDRIQVVWEIEDRLPLLLPPLSIQPLVENAIRHGLLKRDRGGTIRIRIAHFKEYAEISVQDDGIGMDENTLSQALAKPQTTTGRKRGVGLVNTDRRLKQLYGEGLRIVSAPGEGTTVSFVASK